MANSPKIRTKTEVPPPRNNSFVALCDKVDKIYNSALDWKPMSPVWSGFDHGSTQDVGVMTITHLDGTKEVLKNAKVVWKPDMDVDAGPTYYANHEHLTIEAHDLVANKGILSEPAWHYAKVIHKQQDAISNTSENVGASKHSAKLFWKGVDPDTGVAHDKVYHASLEPDGDNWKVTFDYGPAGKTLKGGTKIGGATYGAAKAVYSDLVAEKIGKGYSHQPGSPKSEIVTPLPTPKAGEGPGTGKPCGDSHISADKTCHVGEGKSEPAPKAMEPVPYGPGGTVQPGDFITHKYAGEVGATTTWKVISEDPKDSSKVLLECQDDKPILGSKKGDIVHYDKQLLKSDIWLPKDAEATPVPVLSSEVSTVVGHSGVDTSSWPSHNSAAQWGMKKIKMMEGLFGDGDFTKLLGMDTQPKSASPNKYQKGVYQAWANLVAKVPKEIADKAGVGKPASSDQTQVQKAATDGLKSTPVAKPAVNPEYDKQISETMAEAVAKVKDIHSINPNLEYGMDKDVVDATQWKKTGDQLGSNPGGTYIDLNGNKWYVKESKSNDHALNEVLTAKLYEAAGARVLPYKLAYLGPGKLGTATPWMEKTGSPDASNPTDVMATHHDFAVHAWLANWDCAGASSDNLAWVKHGNTFEMTELDVGGGLGYRAQGGVKGSKFNTAVSEWDTLRNSDIAPIASQYFKNMTPKELVESAKSVAGVPSPVIDKLVKKYSSSASSETSQLSAMIIARKNVIVSKANAIDKLEAPKVEEQPVVAEAKPTPFVAPDKDQLPALLPKPTGKLAEMYPLKSKKLYDAALTGDVMTLDNIQSNSFLCKQYKSTLLAYVKGEGVFGEQAKLDAALSTKTPDFLVSVEHPKSATVGLTDMAGKAIWSLWAAAKAKDLPAVESFKAYSDAVVSYQNKLVASLKNELAKAQPAPVTPPTSTPEPPTPGDVVKPTAPSIPPPPKVPSSNAHMEKKFTKLYEAAMTGDAKAVEAIQTDPNAKNSYSKMQHGYKLELLYVMGVGEKPLTAKQKAKSNVGAFAAAEVMAGIIPAPKSSGKPLALKDSELPKNEEWGGPITEKNTVNYAEAQAKMAQLNAWAAAGDLDKVKNDPPLQKPKSITLNPSQLPTITEWGGPFTSSKAANVAANMAKMEELNKLALAGDLAKIKAEPSYPSGKLNQYKEILVKKMTPEESPLEAYKQALVAKMTPPYSGEYNEILKACPLVNNATAKKKLDYIWVIGHLGAPIAHNYGQGKWITNTTGSQPNPGFEDFIKKTKDAWSKFPSNAKSQVSTLKGNYTEQNISLSNGNPTPGAKTLGKALMEYAPVVPEGTNLLRYYELSPKAHKEMETEILPGDVLQIGSIIESSDSKSWKWHYDICVKMTCGPGVKALDLGVAHGDGERETIFPPNTVYVIQTKPEWKDHNGKHVLYYEALVMPTNKNQF